MRFWLWTGGRRARSVGAVPESPAAEQVEAAATALEAELRWSVPVSLGGDGGWLAVAARALGAAGAGVASPAVPAAAETTTEQQVQRVLDLLDADGRAHIMIGADLDASERASALVRAVTVAERASRVRPGMMVSCPLGSELGRPDLAIVVACWMPEG